MLTARAVRTWNVDIVSRPGMRAVTLFGVFRDLRGVRFLDFSGDDYRNIFHIRRMLLLKVDASSCVNLTVAPGINVHISYVQVDSGL